jgi:hypothetical protein
LLDLRCFLQRDGRDGIAFLLSGVAFQEDAGRRFYSGKKFH